MEFINVLIKKYKSTIYWEALVNVILVFHGARDAFLYESTNFKNDTNFIFLLVEKFNKYGSKLKIKSDEFKYPRFFVYKENGWVDKDIQKNPMNLYSDPSIAGYLGFQCVGHDFSNYRVPRITIGYYIEYIESRQIIAEESRQIIAEESRQIIAEESRQIIAEESRQIIAEVCEINKIPKSKIVKQSNEKLKRFNNVLNKYGIKMNVSINVDDGLDTRTKNLFENKKKYILKNKEDYKNDLANNYLNDDWEKSFTFKYLEESKTDIDKNLLTVLKIIYKYINDGLFDKVFDMYSLKEAGGRILEFDECIWNYIKSSKTDHYKCLDILNIIGGGSKEQHKKNEQHKKKMNNIKKNDKDITT
jgi:hypothetical protein